MCIYPPTIESKLEVLYMYNLIVKVKWIMNTFHAGKWGSNAIDRRYFDVLDSLHNALNRSKNSNWWMRETHVVPKYANISFNTSAGNVSSVALLYIANSIIQQMQSVNT